MKKRIKPSLLFFVADGFSEYNSSHWRTVKAANILIGQGYDVRICHIREWLGDTPYSRLLCEQADLITIQRVMVDESIKQVEKWRSRGKAVNLDIDDGYSQLKYSPENPATEFWIDGMVTVGTGGYSYKKYIGYDPLEQLKRGVSRCTSLTAPSKILAGDYRPYGNTFYLPNYIDSEKYIDVPKKKHGDEIWIGYGASMGHVTGTDASGVGGALKRLLKEKDNIRFILIGDKRIASKLDLPEDKLIFRNYVPHFRWINELATYDISIAPLSKPFDMRRSFIKALEASIMKIPFIGTGDEKYPVYEEFYGSPAHIYVPSELTVPDYDNRVEYWYNAMNQMIDNIEDYRERAEESFEIGMEYDVKKRIDDIIHIYKQIIDLDL